jgi:uncharacterized protein YbjT (DUF2867 family)
MNLVVGATGMVGSEICKRLAARGKHVRALVRSTSDQTKVGNLKQAGVEIIQGDLQDRASLEAACQGVTSVISTASAMPFSYNPIENNIQQVDQEGLTNLIDVAKVAGVKHIVYISLSSQMDLDFPLRNAKRKVEQYLKNSGLLYTILRPSYFMEVWLSPAVGFDAANSKAQLCGDGTNPVGYISYLDVAQFAIESLRNPAAKNATLELGGPESISQLDAVKIFEQASGRNFEVQHVPEEALKSQQDAAPDPMQQSFSGLMRCVAQGDPIDMKKTLKAFPIKLTSVREYAGSVFSTS